MSDEAADNLSLFDLFCLEVQSNLEVLNQGLELWEVQPPKNGSGIAEYVRAAHSLKGAARVVELDSIVKLASAMEQQLIKVQETRIKVDSDWIAVMGKGVRLLKLTTGWKEKTAKTTAKRTLPKINTLIEELDAFDPDKVPETSDSETEITSEAEATPTTEEPPAALADTSLMDLFRLEIETQAAAIDEKLLELETDFANVECITELMRAAHSLKGAARIVNLDSIVQLTHTMEDYFVAVQNGKLTATNDTVDQMFECLDFLKGVAQWTNDEVTAKAKATRPRVNAMIAKINDLGKEKPAPDSPPKTETEATPFNDFRQATEAQFAVLSKQCNELTSDEFDAANVEQLKHAAGSFKEAAQAVDLASLASFTAILENYLAACLTEKKPFSGEAVKILAECGDFFREWHSWDVAEWPQNLKITQPILQDLNRRLQELGPAAPPQEPQVPASAEPEPAADKDRPDFMDATMLELFLSEVETQTGVLSENLLVLEADTSDLSQVEIMMRAAHSLKGAARIVYLPDIVQLTHTMEDHFVGIQKGVIKPTSDTVDVMLSCVDILKQLTGINADNFYESAQALTADCKRMIAKIGDLLGRQPSSGPQPAKQPAAKPPAAKKKKSPDKPAAKSSASTSSKSQFVRISSKNINQIIELAAQCLVESRNQGHSSQQLTSIRLILRTLLASVNKVKDLADTLNLDQSVLMSLVEVSQHATQAHELFTQHLESFEDYIRRNTHLSENLYQESMSSRMRPFSERVEVYPRMIRDIARSIGKKVKLDIRGKNTEVDRDVLEKIDAPISHILRNALDHGLETPEIRSRQGKPEAGTIMIIARHYAGTLCIEIRDDGSGIDTEKLKKKIVERKLTSEDIVAGLSKEEVLEFLFLPSFSTAANVTELSGRGVGLDVVQSTMQQLGGTATIETQLGVGTAFHLKLPITRSVVRTLLLTIAEELYALPISRVNRVIVANRDQIESVESRLYLSHENKKIGLISAQHILALTREALENEEFSIVILNHQSNLYGLIVDHIHGETELVARPLDPRLGQVPNVNATAVHENGTPILILNVDDLILAIDNQLGSARWGEVVNPRNIHSHHESHTQRILVVDDSITVRQLQKQILESSGYEVHLATDGVEGWNAIRLTEYDLIISDIDMPRMTGFELLGKIREEPKFAKLPVIIVSYKDREEDRQRGLNLGANYYLTKSSFENETYTNAVTDLIGQPQ